MKTKQALDALDKAIALIGKEDPRRPDEFTVAEYAARAGMSIPHAGSILRNKSADGVLKFRRCRINGRSSNLYSLA